MSYIDDDQGDIDESQELANAIERQMADDMAAAVDAAYGIKRELLESTPDGLLGYIEACRAKVVAALTSLPVVSEIDVAIVIELQKTLLLYVSAVEFATNTLRGYSLPGGDSAPKRDRTIEVGDDVDYGEGED